MFRGVFRLGRAHGLNGLRPAWAALITGLVFLLGPVSAGGGAGEAFGFAAFAAAAAYPVHRLWVGPRRSAATVARALGNRFYPRRL